MAGLITNLIRRKFGETVLHRSALRHGYSKSEISEALRAYRTCEFRNEVTILGHQVKFADAASFKYLLKEVVFDALYCCQLQTDAPVIFDCGANIGIASLFFKREFPNSTIEAFEAAPQTFRILSENIAGLPGTRVHHLALWNEDDMITFYTSGDNSDNLRASVESARLDNATPVKVQAARLSSFMDRRVDLLKIDVEGAEWEILDDLVASGKIELVQNMIIEFHHKVDGAPSKLSQFLRIIEGQDFEYQVDTNHRPILRSSFQDILIGAYRSSPLDS